VISIPACGAGKKNKAGINAGQNLTKKEQGRHQCRPCPFDAKRSPLIEDRRQRRGAVDDDLAAARVMLRSNDRASVASHKLATKG
jgi:hypothetical protein